MKDIKKVDRRGKRLTKIERAGKDVVEFVIELARDEDSMSSIAKKVNRLHGTDINSGNVHSFLKQNQDLFMTEYRQKIFFEKFRAKLYLRHTSLMVEDSKKIDKYIEKIDQDEYMNLGDKSDKIGTLIDKRGKLLLRHAKLTGKLDDPRNVVNIQQNINFDNSEIIKQLRQANFKMPKTLKLGENSERVLKDSKSITLKEDNVIDVEAKVKNEVN